MSQVIKHLILSILVFLVGVMIQWYYASSSNTEVYVLKNYLFQFMIATSLISLFAFLHAQGKKQIGFTYLMMISAKFILVFIFIYPDFTSDPKIPGLNFTTFFIPFIIGTILEITFLLKLLKE